VEDELTPAARSRHLARRFCWPTTGREDPDEIVDGLLRIGRSIGETAILMTTDDEAAVLVAEHADRLARWFLMPATPPGLPRRLAGKQALHELCVEHGIPSPASVRPRSHAEAVAAAERLGFPVVVKNDEPWLRLSRPAVASSTIIRDRHELRRLIAPWDPMPAAIVQEYVPPARARDWIAHAYVAEDPAHDVVFTGRKLRSWPPRAGVTTYAYTRSNADLSALTRELCRRVGFRGVCDLDWRFDSLSGQYKLLDFNPRVGAQFRLFEREDGVDVVRAMHIDLTGRELPAARQVDGRRYIVENLDVPAAIAYARSRGREAAPSPVRHRELAWCAADDPVPAVLAGVRSAALGASRILTRRLGSHGASG
jgi:predicted ATP-grasp superfamily ATP-dependent carboligase